MGAKPVNGSENGARSGAQTLTHLALPLNLLILRALASGPKRQVELLREAGSPAQSTLRSHLAALQETGAIVKRRGATFPGSLEYELAEPGRELRLVTTILESWLQAAPDGPLQLGTGSGKAAVRALTDAWSSTMLRALAIRPLTLTALDGLVTALNYPALERRLTALRLADLVEPVAGNGAGTPYAITRWLRRGVAPLAVASRWERRNARTDSPPVAKIDAETGLMLAVPLLRPMNDVTGTCRLVVELPDGGDGRLASVTVMAEDGRITSCALGSREANAWATGPPNAWFGALIEADPAQLEIGGDSRLIHSLLESFHGAFTEPAGKEKYLSKN